ncbi:MAG: asparagine synthase (glutamine-hydrolyzing) [Spirulina sp.]
MCGICGSIGHPPDRDRLARAMDRLAHRGPDQAGSVLNRQLILGHRRLAILDLSDQGRQPMTNEDQTLWLVFNGEIYNFEELRALLAPHHHFQSTTDSEVLVHGYEQWGIDGLLQRLRGMYAFALWDDTTATLHLVRDPLGKKPLYYTTLGGGLTFASTLPALLELLGQTPAISSTAILNYLTYLCVPAPQSLFEGIYKLPPAHRLEFSSQRAPRLVRYWQPDFTRPEQRSPEEWIERIDATLTAAVQDRLVADVPVGAFLSGGVDSSLVVACMAHLSPRPVQTISVGFAEQAFNELPHARRVAQVCGTQHQEYILHPDAAAVLPDLVFQYGEPFADHSALPTYYAAKAAGQQVKVVLTGDGGDELFAGYRHLPALRMAHLLHHLPQGLKSTAAAGLAHLERRGHRRARSWRWLAAFAQGPQGTYSFDPVGSRTWRPYRQALLGPALRSVPDPGDQLYQTLWEESPLKDWVSRAMAIDLVTLLPDGMLTKVDVATMAHGLEARSPLLDLRLVELASKIPAGQQRQGWQSKFLLKQLARKYFPEGLLNRPKQGFSLPTSDWLRGDMGPLLESVLLSPQAQARQYFCPEVVAHCIAAHRQGKADHGQRLWSLLLLELWFQMFIDKTLAPGDRLVNFNQDFAVADLMTSP